MASEKITRTTLLRLRRRQAKGRGAVEVRDVVQPGLSIRATGKQLSWYFRYTKLPGADGRVSRAAEALCTADACDDPDALRRVVARGKAALRDGRDPVAAARIALAEILRMPETRVAADDPNAPIVMTWKFTTLREEFRRNPPDWLREETVASYCRAMSPFQVDALEGKYLTEITPADIRQVRSQIEGRGNNRQAALTVQAIKSAFEWAAEDAQKRRSGITPDTNPAAEVSTKSRHKRKRTKAEAIAAAANVRFNADGELVFDDGSVPSPEDLGRLLILLLDAARLPLLKRAVLLLLLYSAQRRYNVACALRKVVITNERTEYSVWVMDAGMTKSGLPHILPFSRVAGDVIEKWKASSAGGDWLFSGLPTQAKPRPTGHLNVRTLNDWLAKAWQQAGASRSYSPHKIRKAFDTYLSRRRVSRADRKLVLHHHEGRNNDVTDEHYNFDPRLNDKLLVINVWNDFLLSCVEKVKNADQGRDLDSSEDFGTDLLSRAPVNAAKSVINGSDNVEPQPKRILGSDANDTRTVGEMMPKAAASAAVDQERNERVRQHLQRRADLDAAFEADRKSKTR